MGARFAARGRRGVAARFAGFVRAGAAFDAARFGAVLASGDFAAARLAVDLRAADFFATAFFAAAFFAAVFVRDAFRATVFFPRVALLGALRALAAFFARFAGARADFADFLPVDFRAGLRAVLLVRLVGLIAVSGSGSRAECAGSAKTSLAK